MAAVDMVRVDLMLFVGFDRVHDAVFRSSLLRFIGSDAPGVQSVQSGDTDHVLSGSYAFIASAVFAVLGPKSF